MHIFYRIIQGQSMQDRFQFYKEQIKKHKACLSDVKRRLFISSMLRLAVFCSTIIAVYFFFGNTKWLLASVLFLVIVFIFLVSRHKDLQNKRDKFRVLININKTELKVLERDFHQLPEGNEFKDADHHYSQDIDLFGKGSFYQYANRTSLREGSHFLGRLLKENSVDDIPGKQEAIRELSEMPEWRQDFSVTSMLAKTEIGTAVIIKWLNAYIPFVPRAMRFVPWVFSVASIGVLLLYYMDVIPGFFLLIWMLIGLGIMRIYKKKIIKLMQYADEFLSTFQQYYQLLRQIEDTDFTSEYLQNRKKRIHSEGLKSSRIIQTFFNLLNSLDKNHSEIYLIFANGFFLRTLTHCYHLEQWIKNYGNSVEKWFHTIAFFDSYNSLGNFAFNHPKYSYPKLSHEKIVLQSKDAGHPLLDPEKSVPNYIHIENEQFFIITGANMAGKSTFLRTVSLQIVMANIGLPVCASHVTYSPIKLITSMRTTDSLTDDESYFFSELKRLKFIVDEIDNDRYFIVLDEILKGTNSIDKAKGSRKFIEKLVATKSTGLIATHDLSICDVAQEFPQILNYYFDAEIIDNELYFDYVLKAGICQNMNASFLLKKMKIIE